MRRVEKQLQTPASGNFIERIDVAGTSPNVHADDTGRSWCDRLLYFFWIESASLRIDVAKHRRDSLPLKRVGGSDKGERWHNDFTSHLRCPNRDLQGDSAIAHGNTVLHLNQVGNSLLELFYKRTIVG